MTLTFENNHLQTVQVSCPDPVPDVGGCYPLDQGWSVGGVHGTGGGCWDDVLLLLSWFSLPRHLLTSPDQRVEVNILRSVHIVLGCLGVLVLDQLISSTLEEISVEYSTVMQSSSIVQWSPSLLVLGLIKVKDNSE